VSVTTYTTVNGQILSQSKDGVVHHFVSDPLGSVVMVRDNAGNTVYEAEYDPYGNVQSETGTNPSEFGYVGTLGYVKDSAFSLYVRARYLLTNLGRWLTKDPLWPSEPGFVYADASPIFWVDSSGLGSGKRSCTKPEELHEEAKCKKLNAGGKLLSCIAFVFSFVAPVCSLPVKWEWTVVVGKCGSKHEGDCSPVRHAALQAAVNKYCKQSGHRSCVSGNALTCDELRRRLALNAQCAGARRRINDECYRGGNRGHRIGFREAMASVKTCQEELRNHQPPC